MAVDMENHPHANPLYLKVLRYREARLREWRIAQQMAIYPVPRPALPRLPNKYLPHTGNKELARHANP